MTLIDRLFELYTVEHEIKDELISEGLSQSDDTAFDIVKKTLPFVLLLTNISTYAFSKHNIVDQLVDFLTEYTEFDELEGVPNFIIWECYKKNYTDEENPKNVDEAIAQLYNDLVVVLMEENASQKVNPTQYAQDDFEKEVYWKLQEVIVARWIDDNDWMLQAREVLKEIKITSMKVEGKRVVVELKKING